MKTDMKHIFSKFISALALTGLAISLGGCVEEIPSVNDELSLGRCLTPTEGSVSISPDDGQTVTFTWTTSKGPSNYIIEIFSGAETAEPDEVFAGEPLETLVPETSPANIVLAADKYYFARVKAQKEGIEDSKWLTFPYPIGTYEVKSSVNPELVTRTSEAITVSWTQVDGFIVDHIRVSPNPDPEATTAYKRYEDVPEVAEGGKGEYTVTGLAPSTKYTVAIHYRSANRGEVYVWTRPSLEGATVVTNSEQLIAALKDGAPVIQVEYSDTPYSLYTVDATEAKVDAVITPSTTGQLKIVGNGTEDGQMPVINGVLNIPDGVTELHVEGISFDGENYSFSHPIVLNKGVAKAISSVTMLNCDVTAYKAGFFYYDSGTANIGDLIFKNIMVSDIQGEGGNAFDIRSEVEINKIEILESTFTEGMRTFLRIDKAKVASMYFNNNTVNNLCFVDNGNNKGLFYIGAGKGQVEIPVFEMTKNLFLNLNGHDTRTVFFSDEKGVPSKISSNYYYRLGPGFWAKDDDNTAGAGKLSQSAGLAGGGAILSGDPCENSSKGNLYLKKTSEAFEKGIGDPRWFENYVIVPENLELTPVEYGKSWNLTDTKVFGKTVEKDMVRDGMRFFVTATPFNVTETGLEFTGEGTVESTGVPADGAIAFKVNGPGSVIVSVEKSNRGSSNDHLTVALGDADGKTASVKGSAPVDVKKVKVAFPTIAAGTEQIVYLYACGPVVLTAMQWSDNVDTGAPAVLDTPVLTIDQPSVDDTYTGEVKVSWPEVSSAGSYTVTVNGEESSVKLPEYVFKPADMTPGTYTVTVQAIPAEDDLSKEPSEISEELVFEIKETLKPVSASVPTTWGNDDFAHLFEVKSLGSKDTEVKGDFVYNNLSYLNGSGKCKFGEDTYKVTSDDEGVKAYRYQFGGSGSITKQTLQFIVNGNGTLTVKAASSGSSDRYIGVSVGETEISGDNQYCVTKDKLVKTFEIPVTTAAAGDIISIYSKGSGINVFELVWTPAGYDPDAVIPSDETAINEAYIADYSNTTDFPAEDNIEEARTIKGITYVGASGKAIQFDPASKRIKFKGGAPIDAETGLPTSRYASFKITKPGTIHHKLIASNKANTDTEEAVAIVLTKGDETEVRFLYKGNSGLTSGDEIKTTPVTEDILSGCTASAVVYVFCPNNKNTNLYAFGFTPAAE